VPRRLMSSRHGLAGVLSRWGVGAPLLCTLLALLALPAAASAQATRTWVSGVGDDANPCSRTAPCKTWAGAISKTAAGGEIDALDPGGFGALTITKSIMLDGGGGQVASTLVAGTNGIVVVGAAHDNVVIRNMRFDGLAGDGSNLGNAGTNGVVFLGGASLRLENDTIFGFGNNGVLDTNPGSSSLVVSNTTISDSFGDGVLVAPGSGGSATAVLENDSLENNACGLAVTTLGTGSGTCGIGSSAVGTAANATVIGTSVSANTGDGVLSAGSASRAILGSDLVTANNLGLDPKSSGQIVSLCGSFVAGNTNDGSPTSTVSTGCTLAGPVGATGSIGQSGATGLTGAAGPGGRVELVTCKQVKVKIKRHGKRRTVTRYRCTGKLVSGPVKFTTSRLPK
jgi:hypothetical protein